MNIERELGRALRREAPPGGFADRVMGLVAEEEASSEVSSPPRARIARLGTGDWRALAAALLLVALLGGLGAREMAERRKLEGERAREQVLLALQITSEKLRIAQEGVHAIGTRN